MTSTIATGGFDEVVAPPDGALPGAECSSSTELRRVAEEPCRAADLGGADGEGCICSGVGGRDSFDLRRPSFSRMFPKMLERRIEAAISHFPSEVSHCVRRLLNDLAQQGKGIIMISSELPEVLRMSHRIIVMCEGRITGELSSREATQEKIMALATQRGAITATDAA